MTSKLPERQMKLLENLNCQMGEGVLYPVWHLTKDMPEHMELMKRIELRPDDTLAVGYPRSGNHWAFEVVNMILSQSTEHRGDKYGDNLLEHRGPQLEQTLAQETSPRQLVTHRKPRVFPKQLFEKGVKVVYLLRNPKDVIHSFYKLWKDPGQQHNDFRFLGDFGDYLDLDLAGEFPFGTWFDHVLEMERFMEEHPEVPVHVHVFEHMKEDPEKAVKAMCDFLGYSNAIASQIADSTKMDKMKSLDKFQKTNEPTPLLGKAKSGGWRNVYTVAQSEMVDAIFEKKMAGSKLGDLVRPYI